jgi:5'-3' exonuclease
MYDRLIIDGNNLFYRNYAVFSDKGPDGKAIPTEIRPGVFLFNKAIEGFFRSVTKLERDLLKPGGKIHFLFDNPNSKINMKRNIISREVLSDTYKKDRESKPKEFYRTVDQVRDLLYNYKEGWTVSRINKMEADDLVKPLLRTIPEDEKLLMVTNDLDWARSLNERIHMFKNEKVFTPDDFKEKYGFYPTEETVILYKCIRGDKSDTIPIGVKGMRSDLLVKIIEKYKDVYDMIIGLRDDKDISEAWKKKIRESANQLKQNHQLVSFIEVGDKAFELGTVTTKFNPKTLFLMYKALNINREVIFDSRVQYGYEGKDKFVFGGLALPRK